MTPEQWSQVETLYDAARTRSAREQATLLDSADFETRSQVEQMLANDSNGRATLSGLQLGPYRIESPIGSGGMGTVYRATDTRLGRAVALKTSQAIYNQRFQMEAHAISALNHPNICMLYDVGPDYLVMELLEGTTLSAEIAKGPMAPEQLLQYGAQIASALAEAHARHIIHRDLKPSNIMLTRHGVKVLDFGLARILSREGITESNVVMGTPAYMAPEQVQGREATARTDLFALGLLLYEMSSGKLPVPGASLGLLLSTGSKPSISFAPQPPNAPAGLQKLVRELLASDSDQRPDSAAAVLQTLSAIARSFNSAKSPVHRSRYLAITVSLLSLLAIAGWAYFRFAQTQWVSDEAIPQITQLSAKESLAAFQVLLKAEKISPHDERIAKLAQAYTRRISINSVPSGATVAIQDYAKPGEWYSLGTTPLPNVRIPNGYFRWRLTKAGAGKVIAAPTTDAQMHFVLSSQEGTEAMDHVPAGVRGNMIDFVGWFIYQLPAFDVDRYEVTNQSYQRFVDAGGYKKADYWKEPFIENGKQLAWERAMNRFRDTTGRPGPSTWEGGHFPPGHFLYPVSGISWYEAAAYAVFAGKSLPTLAQWYSVADENQVVERINQSNFNGHSAVPVGTFPGVGPYGTYDLNGNVREWCLNAVDGDRRFILGGAWRTQTYQAYDPEALPPFDRSSLNGFRCVRNQGPLPAKALAPVVRQTRDLAHAKPVPDAVFDSLRLMYAYDPLPLNPKSDGIIEKTADWTKEKVTIDAGYGNESLPVFVFLPRNVPPPYQSVLFFPSASVNSMPSSDNLGDMDFIDYVIKSGRAVVYPIFKGTYERMSQFILPGDIHGLDQIIERCKEVRRTVDYLETRHEMDRSNIAYLGVSQGAAEGVIYTVIENRFKTVVFLDGGFFLGRMLPAEDQVNFAPRLKKPVLMINGRYDFTFSLDRAQEPFFRMLGTPAAAKSHLVFDTPHDVSQNKPELSRQVLDWLDRYLGRVY